MTNPILFPTDFPNISQQSELEDAVTQLRTEAVNTARQQAHTRRIGGQQAIENQNRLIMAIPDLMPLNQIGQLLPPAVPVPATGTPLLGTVGVLGGGRTYNSARARRMWELLYSNEFLSHLGARLSDTRVYLGTVGNENLGTFCGGSGDSRVIDVYRYEHKTVERSAVEMPINRFGMAGGIQNRNKGVFAGGTSTRLLSTRNLQRVNFTNPLTTVNIANFLATARFCPHGSPCSATFGYVYSGTTTGFSGAPLSTIERINHTVTPETVSTLGTSISASNFHIVHASFGHSTAGFLSSGSNTNPVSTNWLSNVITKLPFSTEIPAVLSTTLANARVCADGVGSNLAGYTVAGHALANWGEAAVSVERLAYDPVPEQNRRIAIELRHPQSDQGAISDYGAGFS